MTHRFLAARALSELPRAPGTLWPATAPTATATDSPFILSGFNTFVCPLTAAHPGPPNPSMKSSVTSSPSSGRVGPGGQRQPS